ncbi:S-adenosyl-L-methionine-dependent methyltransferase [Macrophomina phaseolina]|uniref:S-adenosyl-L-methionine-dependent methyltransferase n=1 Tax=Macrophomina phaseolina TaxID=35725 RepID=A0ABQ8GAI5_9PEZI|nr:S-adenosyl-L-methionine-dependent methyltransferase [Macrophomina phaseolina]
MSTTNSSTERFNAEAAAWDSNPVTVRSSQLAYEALLEHVPSLKASKPNILEIGCGTGLLSLPLSAHANTLVGVDLAAGMVAALNAKLAGNSPTTTTTTTTSSSSSSSPTDKYNNIAAVATLLTHPDQPEIQSAARSRLQGRSADAPVRWDLVVSHLTLHHIPDMLATLRTCHACLARGGAIALTDFEDCGDGDAVLFHPASKRADVERHGIKREEMAALIEQAGFGDVSVERAFVLEKEVDPAEAGGRTSVGFPFLICKGTKLRN